MNGRSADLPQFLLVDAPISVPLDWKRSPKKRQPKKVGDHPFVTELLADANRAGVNVGRMIDAKTAEQTGGGGGGGGGGDGGEGGGAAMARAERRAARLAELTSRPVAEPLPSEGAAEGGVKEILAGMAAVRT